VGIRSAEATCTCSCGAPLLNPCLQGATTASFRSGNTNCNDGDRGVDARDGGCFATGFSWTGFNASDGSTTANGLSGPPPTPAAVACAAKASLPAVIDDGSLDVCGRNPDCVASTPAGTKICVLAKGRSACPPGYPTMREVSTRDGIKDGRTCAACRCQSGATSCVDAVLTFYSDDSCSVGARSVTLDGKCNAISGTGSPTHYRFSARPDSPTCNPDSGSVAMEGSLESDPQTLCCPE
jgi:hypothetical protein